MGKVQGIERQVEELSPQELAEFRDWFAAFDAEAWDRRFEADATAGRLGALADKALGAHAKVKPPNFEPLRFSRLLGLLSGTSG
jgi:hypothetical protein